MTALTWAVRLIIFSFLLVFALRNTQLATLRFILDYAWEAPLVIVLLLATLYGHDATLTVQPAADAEGGTEALIEMPLPTPTP